MWSAVEVTPLVVEYDTARLSDREGAPARSAPPLHASTTGRPRWYTPTAPPLPDSATWASRIATTSSNAGSHVPCAMAPTLLSPRLCRLAPIARLVKEQYRARSWR